MRLAHLSTSHHIDDVRVVRKECCSLCELGHDVTLVLPGGPFTSPYPGLVVHGVGKPSSRLLRMTWTAFLVFRIAWRLKVDIYHFHSPDLLPWMFLLLLRGRPIIYDVHEDFQTGILRAIYLPHWLAVLAAWFVRVLEQLARRYFTIVIAEKYYRDIFPNSTEVLNYPRLEDYSHLAAEPASSNSPPVLLYTGSVIRHRGALQYAALARAMPDVHVRTVGIVARGLVQEMSEISGNAPNLEIIGVRRWVSYEEILAAYATRPALGIALFPDTDHYRQKELTKFFEYMAAGIPIVCSDFPVWRALIAQQGVGICVDPADLDGTVQAIRSLLDDLPRREAMSENGRRLATSRYHWDGEAARLDAIYQRLHPPVRVKHGLWRRLML